MLQPLPPRARAHSKSGIIREFRESRLPDEWHGDVAPIERRELKYANGANRSESDRALIEWCLALVRRSCKAVLFRPDRTAA